MVKGETEESNLTHRHAASPAYPSAVTIGACHGSEFPIRGFFTPLSSVLVVDDRLSLLGYYNNNTFQM